jgi:hypothetical protein
MLLNFNNLKKLLLKSMPFRLHCGLQSSDTAIPACLAFHSRKAVGFDRCRRRVTASATGSKASPAMTRCLALMAKTSCWILQVTTSLTVATARMN